MSVPEHEIPFGDDQEGLEWQRLSDIEMRSIVFLDKPLWQGSAFHLTVGRKGVGKGTMLADLASRVTRGELGDKRNVVWIGSEDSAAIDIKPRVVAAGGDPERVIMITDWIQLPRDIDKLGVEITKIGDVGLVIIDPVGNHITGKSSNADTDIRDAIAPLNDLADEHETMVVGVRHLTEKEAKGGVIAAILGASAWVQVPRAVIAIARDKSEGVSVMQCVAGNRMPPDTPGRAFRIEGVTIEGLENEVTRAVWVGDSVKDVEALIGESAGGKEPSKSEVARELILDALEETPDGRIESDELDARIARETGLVALTVRNLRTQIGNDGLIKSVAERDEHGQAKRWFVVRTNAARPKRSRDVEQPDHDLDEPTSAFGLDKPDHIQITRHNISLSGQQITIDENPDHDSVDTGSSSVSGSLTAGCLSPAPECPDHGSSRHWRSVASGDIHCAECIAPVVEGAVAEWIEAAA